MLSKEKILIKFLLLPIMMILLLYLIIALFSTVKNNQSGTILYEKIIVQLADEEIEEIRIDMDKHYCDREKCSLDIALDTILANYTRKDVLNAKLADLRITVKDDETPDEKIWKKKIWFKLDKINQMILRKRCTDTYEGYRIILATYSNEQAYEKLIICILEKHIVEFLSAYDLLVLRPGNHLYEKLNLSQRYKDNYEILTYVLMMVEKKCEGKPDMQLPFLQLKSKNKEYYSIEILIDDQKDSYSNFLILTIKKVIQEILLSCEIYTLHPKNTDDLSKKTSINNIKSLDLTNLYDCIIINESPHCVNEIVYKIDIKMTMLADFIEMILHVLKINMNMNIYTLIIFDLNPMNHIKKNLEKFILKNSIENYSFYDVFSKEIDLSDMIIVYKKLNQLKCHIHNATVDLGKGMEQLIKIKILIYRDYNIKNIMLPDTANKAGQANDLDVLKSDKINETYIKYHNWVLLLFKEDHPTGINTCSGFKEDIYADDGKFSAETLENLFIEKCTTTKIEETDVYWLHLMISKLSKLIELGNKEQYYEINDNMYELFAAKFGHKVNGPFEIIIDEKYNKEYVTTKCLITPPKDGFFNINFDSFASNDIEKCDLKFSINEIFIDDCTINQNLPSIELENKEKHDSKIHTSIVETIEVCNANEKILEAPKNPNDKISIESQNTEIDDEKQIDNVQSDVNPIGKEHQQSQIINPKSLNMKMQPHEGLKHSEELYKNIRAETTQLDISIKEATIKREELKRNLQTALKDNNELHKELKKITDEKTQAENIKKGLLGQITQINTEIKSLEGSNNKFKNQENKIKNDKKKKEKEFTVLSHEFEKITNQNEQKKKDITNLQLICKNLQEDMTILQSKKNEIQQKKNNLIIDCKNLNDDLSNETNKKTRLDESIKKLIYDIGKLQGDNSKLVIQKDEIQKENDKIKYSLGNSEEINIEYVSKLEKIQDEKKKLEEKYTQIQVELKQMSEEMKITKTQNETVQRNHTKRCEEMNKKLEAYICDVKSKDLLISELKDQIKDQACKMQNENEQLKNDNTRLKNDTRRLKNDNTTLKNENKQLIDIENNRGVLHQPPAEAKEIKSDNLLIDNSNETRSVKEKQELGSVELETNTNKKTSTDSTLKDGNILKQKEKEIYRSKFDDNFFKKTNTSLKNIPESSFIQKNDSVANLRKKDKHTSFTKQNNNNLDQHNLKSLSYQSFSINPTSQTQNTNMPQHLSNINTQQLNSQSQHSNLNSQQQSMHQINVRNLQQQQTNIQPQQVSMSPQQFNMQQQPINMQPQQVIMSPQQVSMQPQQSNMQPQYITMSPQQSNMQQQQVNMQSQQSNMQSQQVNIQPQQVNASLQQSNVQQQVNLQSQLSNMHPQYITMSPQQSNMQQHVILPTQQPNFMIQNQMQQTNAYPQQTSFPNNNGANNVMQVIDPQGNIFYTNIQSQPILQQLQSLNSNANQYPTTTQYYGQMQNGVQMEYPCTIAENVSSSPYSNVSDHNTTHQNYTVPINAQIISNGQTYQHMQPQNFLPVQPDNTTEYSFNHQNSMVYQTNGLQAPQQN